ncbi:MAG: hypothetical protein WAM60_05180 [Candidatus Promineifilaceae bacterium]
MPDHATESKSKANADTPTYAPPAAERNPISQPAAAPLWAQMPASQPTLNASPMVMREDKKETPKTADTEKKADKDVDISFGSAAVPWYVIRPLILKFPTRWQTFAQKAKDDLNKDDRELLSKFSGSVQNLLYAGIYTQLSSYKPSWSQSLKIAENLSGVRDTYLNLVSFAVMRDLEKYLSDDVGDDIKRNLGWMIIYGAFLQGGLVGMDAALKQDLDFTSLLSPATSKFTDAPLGFGRPFQLSNVPDPRWSSYGFGSSPTGFESSLSGYGDPTKPYGFNLKLGLNIASIADLYPEEDKDKAKYKGFELYPYFSLKHEWAQGDTAPTLGNRWLVGAFVGGAGIYTLLEGGQQTKPDNSVAESYLRNALILRGLGRLSQFQLSQEFSFRPENPQVRARLNAAAEIKLVDRKTWEWTVGAGIGGLLPGAGLPGSIDASGSLSLYHKYYQGKKADEDPFKTGLSLGSTWRQEDPFNADSSRLFSIGGKLSILDTVILSLEHHRIQSGLGPLGAAPNTSLPTNDTRFMLMLGPGIWQW